MQAQCLEFLDYIALIGETTGEEGQNTPTPTANVQSLDDGKRWRASLCWRICEERHFSSWQMFIAWSAPLHRLAWSFKKRACHCDNLIFLDWKSPCLHVKRWQQRSNTVEITWKQRQKEKKLQNCMLCHISSLNKCKLSSKMHSLPRDEKWHARETSSYFGNITCAKVQDLEYQKNRSLVYEFCKPGIQTIVNGLNQTTLIKTLHKLSSTKPL